MRIKGDHTYRSGIKVGDRLFCTIEPDSDNAIVVRSRNDDIADHVSEALAKTLLNFVKSQ